MVTVVLGWLLSVGHALLTRGPRAAAALVAIAGGGGLAIEALGVATGFPFGSYDYSGQIGPQLAGVPVVIPLAWTWMAWPAWLAAIRLLPAGAGRIALAAVGLVTWDLFLDPQMVAEGYWSWLDDGPALPGLAGIPISNYLGWLLFAVLVMTALRPLAGAAVAVPGARTSRCTPSTSGRTPPASWPTRSSSACPPPRSGARRGMAVVAVPLAVTCCGSAPNGRWSPPRRRSPAPGRHRLAGCSRPSPGSPRTPWSTPALAAPPGSRPGR